MKKVTVIIVVLLIISMVINLLLLSDRESSSKIAFQVEELKREIQIIENKNEMLTNSVDEYEEKLLSLSEQKVSLEDTIKLKEESISSIGSEYGMIEYGYHIADELLGKYENLLYNFKQLENQGSRQQYIDNLVLPSFVRVDDSIMGMKVVSTRLELQPETEYLYGYEAISFEGKFVVSGYITYDFSEYDTYFIEEISATSIPYMVSNINHKLNTSIGMKGSKEKIEELGYKEGDFITVELENLILARAFGKPMASTADFVRIIE